MQWEQSLQDQREAESMIEAALIGQTFGLLSGVGRRNPTHNPI
jgi:hypothetical protein